MKQKTKQRSISALKDKNTFVKKMQKNKSIQHGNSLEYECKLFSGVNPYFKLHKPIFHYTDYKQTMLEFKFNSFFFLSKASKIQNLPGCFEG